MGNIQYRRIRQVHRIGHRQSCGGSIDVVEGYPVEVVESLHFTAIPETAGAAADGPVTIGIMIKDSGIAHIQGIAALGPAGVIGRPAVKVGPADIGSATEINGIVREGTACAGTACNIHSTPIPAGDGAAGDIDHVAGSRAMIAGTAQDLICFDGAIGDLDKVIDCVPRFPAVLLITAFHVCAGNQGGIHLAAARKFHVVSLSPVSTIRILLIGITTSQGLNKIHGAGQGTIIHRHITAGGNDHPVVGQDIRPSETAGHGTGIPAIVITERVTGKGHSRIPGDRDFIPLHRPEGGIAAYCQIIQDHVPIGH